MTSAQDQLETTLPTGDGYSDDSLDEDWDVAPPPRRRLHWTTAILALALVGVATFAGGILAQKHWGGSSTGGGTFAGRGNLPAGFAQNFRAAAGGGTNGLTPGQGGFGFGGNGTTGTVSYIQGTTLYVTTSTGTVTKVTIPKGLSVDRTVKAKASTLRPGESVVIQGTTASNGTVKATAVTVNAS